MVVEYSQRGGGTGTLARPRSGGLPQGRTLPQGGTFRQTGGGRIRAVIADDAQLMHLAVRAMLAATPGCVLAASAGTVAAAEQLVRRIQPDLLICDAEIAGQSGISLCSWTAQASPRTAVVILTNRDDPLLTQSALAAGARGYLLKTSPPDALICYLEQAAAGRQILDERLGQASQAAAEPDLISRFGLSRREREVLGEVLAGLDNKAIASRLCISEDTVKSHIKAIFRKLGARDRAHAVTVALGTAIQETWPRLPSPRLPSPRLAGQPATAQRQRAGR